MSSISLISHILQGRTYNIVNNIVDFGSRQKVTRALKNKKASEAVYVLKAIYKKGGAFKYPSVLQCDNGSEFKTNKPKSNMKLNDTIKLDILVLGNSEINPEENILPEDGLYKHLFQPGEQHRDQKRPATDFTWSKNTYRLDWVVENLGNHLLYYLQDGPDRAFAREELMHIQDNTQVPPEWVSKWK